MLLFAIYLVIVIALPMALSVVVGYRSLPCGRACPNCEQDTLPLQSRLVKAIQCLHANVHLQRRWCPACDRDGYARVAAGPATVIRPAQSALHMQQLRTLELSGRPWHVMLESWCERNRWYGRLVFMGPSGKLWSDPLAAFSAPTHGDMVRQALSLSDRLLTYRLREVISG